MRGIHFIATALVMGLAGSAQADSSGCSEPASPVIPDGSSASMQDMIAGQQAVKSFQSANMDYMHCLEARFSAAKTRADKAPDAVARSLAEAEYAKAVDAYNAAVSAEEEIAGQFNIELREFKAAQR